MADASLNTAAADGAPLLGPVGIGWRAPISVFCRAMCDAGTVSFVEVIAEGIERHGVPDSLKDLIDLDVPVIAHGVELGIAAAGGVDLHRVEMLARAAQKLGSPIVSEHVAFTRAEVDGTWVEAGHMLPVPRTQESLDILSANVLQVQSQLDVPLVLEQIATLADPGGSMSEAEFLSALVKNTGVGLILDVANARANALNHGTDVQSFLADFPLGAVTYCHVAGGHFASDGLYRDSHLDAVCQDVFDLVGTVARLCRLRGVPVPPMMLERDGHYPSASELSGELEAIGQALTVDPSLPAREPHLGHANSDHQSEDDEVVRPVNAGRGWQLADPKLGLAQWQQEVVGVLRCGEPIPAEWDQVAVEGMRELLARKVEAKTKIGSKSRSARLMQRVREVVRSRK